MARVAPTSAISPQMFRHFAVITVVITACLAMFADGEGRELLENEATRHQQRSAMFEAQAKNPKLASKLAPGVSFTDKRANQGSWSPDPGPPPTNRLPRYTARSDRGGTRVGVPRPIDVSERSVGIAYETPDVLPPGMTAAEAERMNLQQQARHDKKYATEQELELIMARSRARTGAETDDES